MYYGFIYNCSKMIGMSQQIANGTNRIYKKGAPILYQGEVPREGYRLVQGVVKAYIYDEESEELIVAFVKSGEYFPIQWLLNSTKSSIYYFEALSDCKVYAFSRQDFETSMNESDELKQHLFDRLAREYNNVLLRVSAMGQSKARDKILYTMYYMLEQFGKSKDGERYAIDLKITHGMIASLTGLARETIASELGELRQSGVIDYKSRDYSINKPALIKCIGEGNFIDLVSRNGD